MEFETVKQIVEALIFTSESPISASQIKNVMGEVEDDTVLLAVDELNKKYSEQGHIFEIRKVAGGYQFITKSQFGKWIKKFKRGQTKPRLSYAALEALAIIAVKQPVSRTEVAAIRGVHSDGVLRNLLERNLITLAGRAKTVGRPLLYKTTESFLTYFGIDDLAELPTIEEIEQLLSAHMPEERLDKKDAEVSEELFETDESQGGGAIESDADAT